MTSHSSSSGTKPQRYRVSIQPRRRPSFLKSAFNELTLNTVKTAIRKILIGNSCAVKSRGKREKWPVVARIKYIPASFALWTASMLNGRMARRMAFSCTCQPNINDPRAHRTRQRRKPAGPRGLFHRRRTDGRMERRVQIKVASGVTDGRMLCSNS